MRISCEDKALKFSLNEIKSLCLLEIEAPREIQDPTKLLKFEFPDFSVDLEIDTSRSIETRLNDLSHRLTINNLQKDNHIEWIEDWIKWHSRLHNVPTIDSV